MTPLDKRLLAVDVRICSYTRLISNSFGVSVLLLSCITGTLFTNTPGSILIHMLA